MDLHTYNAFTTQLIANLTPDPRVLGLVALGSMAQQSRLPDAWSDHDFFVITQAGAQEWFRQNLSWLPDAAHIVINVRETAHGLRVVYQSGHLIEFAIFDEQELHLAKVNDYRVLFNRANIAAQMVQIVAESSQSKFDAARSMSMFLGQLIVGAGRAARGEVLSAHQIIKQFALVDLLALLGAYLPALDKAPLDNFNPTRRFEQVYPALGAQINAMLLQAPIAAAQSLLDLADQQLRDVLPNYPAQAVEVTRRYLETTSQVPI
jgi:lincosamide nucleotidyltransferase B/F